MALFTTRKKKSRQIKAARLFCQSSQKSCDGLCFYTVAKLCFMYVVGNSKFKSFYTMSENVHEVAFELILSDALNIEPSTVVKTY